ncbi:hypothetical protein Goe20_01460 [Bacillus phage vB_BsuM-Goe20]|nr:hypothetical protein Goe20_01460 [Bacillus phage vB_BsuM-Goe20]
MNIKNMKVYTASLQKVKNLFADKEKQVYGVFYTNSFLGHRYLCRSHVLHNDVNIQEDAAELTITTRVEKAGLLEMENTLDMLMRYSAGDLSGFTPESQYEDASVQPEPVSTSVNLYSIDVSLKMKEPIVTYQNFTLGGSSFTLVNLRQHLDEEIEHTVSLLFGEAEGLYLFSKLYDQDLTARDLKLLLDLIVDENLTGKAIKAVRYESDSGLSIGIFPYEEQISSYTNTAGDYIFGNAAGYVRIPKEDIGKYKLVCEPRGSNGAFQVTLKGKNSRIHLFME